MSIVELGRLLKKRWYVVVLFTVLVGAAAAAVCWYLLPNQYTATASMYVLARNDTSEVITSGDLDTTKSLAISNDVVALLETDRVTGAVSETLGLESLDKYERKVKSSPENRIVTIEVTGEDAETAAKVCNELIKETTTVSYEVLEVKTINIVEEAKVPSAPSGPNRILYTGIAMLCGLVFIILVLQIRATLNRTIPDTESAKRLSGLPMWGVMPYQSGAGKAPKRLRKRRRQRRSGSRRKGSFEIAALENPCKTLFANIRFATAHDKAKTIVVTSSSPVEGKTTVAANLALAIARSGKTALLVEGDLRRKTLCYMLDLEPHYGLFSVLSGKCSAPQAIAATPWDNLFFLDAEEGIASPSDLFSSRRFKTLVQALRTNYDYIVFDTPPIDEFVDAAVLAEEADAILFALREGVSDRRVMQRSLTQLKAAETSAPIGLVMTFSREKVGGRYYRYPKSSKQSTQEALTMQAEASRVYNDINDFTFDVWKAGLDMEDSEAGGANGSPGGAHSLHSEIDTGPDPMLDMDPEEPERLHIPKV